MTARDAIRVLAILSAVTFSASITAQEPPFAEAPTKATMFSKGRFPAGTRLEFTFANARDDETLLLHRCGDPCNTAKLVQTWRLNTFPSDARISAILEEEGQYYFWVQRRLKGGEVGPVSVTSSSSTADTVKVHYASGTEVTVTKVPAKSSQ
jgi:hypothetical protein